jgi:hypothetical protein
MKQRDVFFTGNSAGLIRYASQGIHNLSYINAIGAPNTAGMAGGAEPYCFGGQYPVLMAILDMTEHLVWQDIHGKIDGTPRRTFLALKTVLNFFAADLIDLSQQ